MASPEKNLVNRIRKSLDKHDLPVLHFKIHGGGMPGKGQSKGYSAQDVGLSDIIGCVMGIMFAIEAKVYPRNFTMHQVRFLRKVNESGGVGVGVVIDKNDRVRMLDIDGVAAYYAGHKKDTMKSSPSVLEKNNPGAIVGLIIMQKNLNDHKLVNEFNGNVHEYRKDMIDRIFKIMRNPKQARKMSDMKEKSEEIIK